MGPSWQADENPQAPRHALCPPWLLCAAAVVLSALLLVQLRRAWWLSVTFDETTYLALAQDIFRRGSFEGCVNAGVAPLPILLVYWLPAAVDPYDRPDWGPHPDDPHLVGLARTVHALVIGIPLLLLVLVWLYRRGGLVPALLGGVFVAFSPGILAHCALATTDACFTLTSLLALAALAKYRHRPSRFHLFSLSVVLGLALASKYSAVFLAPAVLVVLSARVLVEMPGSRWRVVLLLAWRLGAVAALSFLVCWAFFGFQVAPLAAADVELSPLLAFCRRSWFPAPLVSVSRQGAQVAGGVETYLLGKMAPGGWRFYYLVVVAVKSTPAELGLAILAVGCLAWSIWRRRVRWSDTSMLWALSGISLFVLMSLATKQLGLRYILPVYPLLVLFAVDQLAGARVGERGTLRPPVLVPGD